jgi:hypothetical protein
VVVVLAIVNVPYLVHEWQLHRLHTEGVQVSATVVTASRSGDQVVLGFKLPAATDPDQHLQYATVDAAEGEAAHTAGQVDVRVLPGHPLVNEVPGEQKGHGATYLTIAADLALVLVFFIAWRFGRRRPALEAVALGDLESGEEGSLLDKHSDGSYLINGELAEDGAESVVIALRDRQVTVHLRGHANPLRVGDRAKVHAHLVG